MHVICRWHSIVAGCEFMLCISNTIGSPLLSLPHNSQPDLPKCHYSRPDKLVTTDDIYQIYYKAMSKRKASKIIVIIILSEQKQNKIGSEQDINNLNL